MFPVRQTRASLSDPTSRTRQRGESCQPVPGSPRPREIGASHWMRERGRFGDGPQPNRGLCPDPARDRDGETGLYAAWFHSHTASVQTAAVLCPGGPGGAIAATRQNAVTTTAPAPMTEKANCQTSEGMRCWTMPCVA